MFLQDGFSTVFRVQPQPSGGFYNLLLRMREVQLPQMNGGPPIDTTTMLNVQCVTKAAQGLVDWGDMTSQCNYDINCTVLLGSQIINKNRYWSNYLPDGSIFAFWGCLYEWTPASLRRGEFPLAEVKVGLLNRIGGSGTETQPTVTAVNPGSLDWPPEPRPVGPGPR